MISKKKDAVELLATYKVLFSKIIGKPCSVKFDMHESIGFIIEDITLQTLKGITHKPGMQEYEGKRKNPMLFTIHNNQAPLIFVFDTTIVSPLGNGVRLSVALDKPLNGKAVVEIDIRLER